MKVKIIERFSKEALRTDYVALLFVMDQVSNFLLFVIFGVILITIIDVVGSMLSRKFSFDYTNVFMLNRLTFLIVGYSIAVESNVVIALAGTCLVGFYDGLAGYSLARYFKANWDEQKIRIEKLTVTQRLTSMLITGLIFGLFGFLLAETNAV